MSFQHRARFAGATIAASLSLLAAAAPAAAEPQPVVVNAPLLDGASVQHVSYRDLDLVQASDQRRLTRRVGAAIKDVCQIHDGQATRSLIASSDYRVCSDGAWEGAQPQLASAIARAGVQLGAGGIDVANGAIIVSARSAN